VGSASKISDPTISSYNDKKTPHTITTNRPPAPKLITKPSKQVPSTNTSASSSKTRNITNTNPNAFTSDFVHKKANSPDTPFTFYDPANLGATYNPMDLTSDASLMDLNKYNNDTYFYSYPTTNSEANHYGPYSDSQARGSSNSMNLNNTNNASYNNLNNFNYNYNSLNNSNNNLQGQGTSYKRYHF